MIFGKDPRAHVDTRGESNRMYERLAKTSLEFFTHGHVYGLVFVQYQLPVVSTAWCLFTWTMRHQGRVMKNDQVHCFTEIASRFALLIILKVIESQGLGCVETKSS